MLVDHGRDTFLLYVCLERQKSGKSRARVILILCQHPGRMCCGVRGRIGTRKVCSENAQLAIAESPRRGGVVRLIKRALKGACAELSCSASCSSLIDGALLALGNGLNLSTLKLALIIIDHSLDTHAPDPIPRRPIPHHRPTKDILLFRAEEQATWDRLLPRTHPPRLSQVVSHRPAGGDVRVSQYFCVRMRLTGCISVLPLLACSVTTIPLRSRLLPLTISS
ncbi:hypothetical protein BGW80DRAFT_508807 [Lactifluus volemus]|nr:hypothetical protein BGW80DRAFT_508807 [Lactifluus volemus]